MDWKARAKGLKGDIPAIGIALRDGRTPWLAKAAAIVTVGYALSPIDLIPDFILALGYLDDLILLPALAALTIKLIPKDVWEQSREKSKGMWKNGKPKRWYYAIPILIVWLFIAWLVVKAIWL